MPSGEYTFIKWNEIKKHARINFPVKNILQEKGNKVLNKVLLLFKGLRAYAGFVSERE